MKMYYTDAKITKNQTIYGFRESFLSGNFIIGCSLKGYINDDKDDYFVDIDWANAFSDGNFCLH